MATAEIDHQEYTQNGNRVLVVLYKGEDWPGDRTERIGVPVHADNQQLQHIVQSRMNTVLEAHELANRVKEVRDVQGDPAGLEVTPSTNPEKTVDELIEYHKLQQKESRSKTEDDRFTELQQRFQ